MDGLVYILPILGRVDFSSTFSWTILVLKLPVLGRVAIFLPFNSRFLDVDGQKLCDKTALVAPLPL